MRQLDVSTWLNSRPIKLALKTLCVVPHHETRCWRLILVALLVQIMLLPAAVHVACMLVEVGVSKRLLICCVA